MWTHVGFCWGWTQRRNKTTRHHDSTIILAGRHGPFGVIEGWDLWGKGREVVQFREFVDG
jgi:hypothetical protein